MAAAGPTLVLHVGLILCVCSGAKMLDVDAARVVAGMKHFARVARHEAKQQAGNVGRLLWANTNGWPTVGV